MAKRRNAQGGLKGPRAASRGPASGRLKIAPLQSNAHAQRTFSAIEKAEVALQAIGGQTIDVAFKYGVDPRLIEEWVQQARLAVTSSFDPPSVDAEMKEVVALFADIVDSTRHFLRGGETEQDYERGKYIQDVAVTLMKEAALEFSGWLEKTEGDGIFALFGAPLAQEDYAVNSCHAALRMLDLVRCHPDLASENVQIRVGLYAGRVMAGAGAFGEPIHKAAHIQKYTAKPGEACISESTYRLVQGLFYVDKVADPQPAGAGESKDNCYRLNGAIPSATRFGVRAARILSPFVGRVCELERLRRAAAAVKAGDKQRVAISGPAGIGKSRLLREFSEELSVQGWNCAELIGAADQQKTLYAPFIRLMRTWCGATDATGPASLHVALAGKISDIDPQLLTAAETLLFAFGLLPDDSTMKALDPRVVRDQARNSLLSLMRARAATDKPLLFLAEDIQWMDAESRAVVDLLAGDDGFRPALMVMTYRCDSNKTDQGRPLYLAQDEQILLGGLSDSTELNELKMMLDSLLGRDAALNALKAELRGRCKGIPLFVEEMVRMLVDTGYLTGQPGSYRASSSRMDYRRPSTIDTIFTARVDHLQSRDKTVLQAAAVLGRTYSQAALAHLVEFPRVEIRTSVSRLYEAGLISAERRADGHWHSFSHALCQEVVYDGLIPSRRERLHDKALDYLKGRFPQRKHEVVEALAHHAVGAKRWGEAIDYLKLACEAAQQRWANRQAVHFYDIGVGVLKELKDDRERLSADLELTLKVLPALRPLGELDRVRTLLDDAERVADLLDEKQRVAVHLQRSLLDWIDGHHYHGLLEAERVLSYPGLARPIAVNAAFCRGIALHALGRFAEAIVVLKTVRADLTGPLQGKRLGWPGDPVSFCDAFLGSALTLSGATAEARVLLEAAAAHAQKIKHPYSIAIVNDVLAEHYLETDHPAAAEPLLLESIDICREHELFTMELPTLARLALAETRAGKWRNAQNRLQKAVEERLDIKGGTYAEGYRLAAQAETTAAAGELDEALKVAEAAEARHRSTGARAAMAQILLFKAGLLRRKLDRLGDARGAAEQARTIARECGMSPLLARCDHLLTEMTVNQHNEFVN